MCKGEGCPLASTCKRYTARANPQRQAYFTKVPFKEYDCEMYWSDQAEMIMKQLKEITNEKGARKKSTDI